ncbi:UDP-galactopyranose mutase [Robbsia andropogonis]|uniref:UDP-galactopyranose mutase n=1 Tax=Robbsia andropogonis TaxID=28092 RepID=A0A0F5JW66_9BURK|nr:UDP-galactopyranose mutase [Robbsia andropogonis]KKB61945.1 UDP-galactopyranose mutase [Robbsia andropogonis]
MNQKSFSIQKYDLLIVGAGFSGSVIARELADAGKTVCVIDKREHIGGNAFDSYDQNGILVHNYGPHIFHANSEKIVRWLSKFTNWRFYEHRVLAVVDGGYYPIPINKTTINQLYGLDLDESGVAAYLESVRIPKETLSSSEDVVLNSVGPDLANKFFRGYTKKQWGLDLAELSAGVAARIPTRSNDDDRYFKDSYQLMPVDGYTRMFERMLDHRNIQFFGGLDFSDVKNEFSYETLVYSGPIDEYYEFIYGKLPYRSLRFEHQHRSDVDQHQLVGTINYPNDYDYTRITEFKHLTGQEIKGTSIVVEYPQSEGDPYYPIPRKKNEELFQKYKALSEADENVFFIGRLGQYRYYNMDQVVGAALALASRLKA